MRTTFRQLQERATVENERLGQQVPMTDLLIEIDWQAIVRSPPRRYGRSLLLELSLRAYSLLHMMRQPEYVLSTIASITLMFFCGIAAHRLNNSSFQVESIGSKHLYSLLEGRYQDGTNVPLSSKTLVDVPNWDGFGPSWAAGGADLAWTHAPHSSQRFSTEWVAGDFIVRGSDGNSTPGQIGPHNVTWACPVAGTLDVSGNAWLVYDFGDHGAVWGVSPNGALLTSGTITSFSASKRATTFDIANGSGGPAVLNEIQVQAGNLIKLRFDKSSRWGALNGVNLSFAHPALPLPQKPLIPADGPGIKLKQVGECQDVVVVWNRPEPSLPNESLPNNTSLGFLPPNTDRNQGQGSGGFTINPNGTLPCNLDMTNPALMESGGSEVSTTTGSGITIRGNLTHSAVSVTPYIQSDSNDSVAFMGTEASSATKYTSLFTTEKGDQGTRWLQYTEQRLADITSADFSGYATPDPFEDWHGYIESQQGNSATEGLYARLRELINGPIGVTNAAPFCMGEPNVYPKWLTNMIASGTARYDFSNRMESSELVLGMNNHDSMERSLAVGEYPTRSIQLSVLNGNDDVSRWECSTDLKAWGPIEPHFGATWVLEHGGSNENFPARFYRVRVQ